MCAIRIGRSAQKIEFTRSYSNPGEKINFGAGKNLFYTDSYRNPHFQIGGITVPRQESEGSLSLDEILADIRPMSSLHLSFMIDIDFLIECYPPSLRSSPITVVVGAPDVADLRKSAKSHPNVTVLGAQLPIPFGTHHSKISILESEDGCVHVIISTANMVSDDWEFKTQQFYHAVGHKSEKKEEVERSPFQEDLIEYLNFYRTSLTAWKNLCEHTDFSTVTDRLIFSTPGYHTDDTRRRQGHPRLHKILSEVYPYDKSYEHSERCTFISQCSSIGSLGPAPINWYRGQFLKSLEAANPAPNNKPAKMYLVFPCVEDVRTSCQGYAGGCSVPYRNSVHARQKWLQDGMCKWRSNEKRRTRAVPHCKTYVKYDKKVAQWQLLTSANLSKAAWGEVSFSKTKNMEQLMIRSWEMGVLIADPTRFNIPFDYPCVPYSAADQPFTTDTKHETPDILGSKKMSIPADFRLSYGSVVLLAEDVEILLSNAWFNDKLLSFMGEYLMNSVGDASDSHSFRRIYVFTPPETEFVRHSITEQDIDMLFGEIGVNEAELVAFIVNNNEDVTTVNGGSHWSLLVYSREADIFRHFDSSAGHNHGVAEILARKLTRLVGQKRNQLKIEKELCLQQTNGHDCGLHVAQFLAEMIEKRSVDVIPQVKKIEKTREWWAEKILNFKQEGYGEI